MGPRQSVRSCLVLPLGKKLGLELRFSSKFCIQPLSLLGLQNLRSLQLSNRTITEAQRKIPRFGPEGFIREFVLERSVVALIQSRA